jgi:hypothetical protein
MAKDPICNMEVDEQTAEFKSQYGNRRTTSAQKNVKNNFDLRGQNSMRVPHKSRKAMWSHLHRMCACGTRTKGFQASRRTLFSRARR